MDNTYIEALGLDKYYNDIFGEVMNQTKDIKPLEEEPP